LSRYRFSDGQNAGNNCERYTFFFISMQLGHHSPVIKLLGIDSRKFRIVSNGILYRFHEERLVHLEMMMEGFCFSPYSEHSGWTISVTIVVAREGVEVYLYAAQTKTAYFWLYVRAN
jgi:hypothetical protein